MTTRRRLAPACATVLALVVAACGSSVPSPSPGSSAAAAASTEAATPSPAPPTQSALDAARAKWDGLHLATFAYTVSTWNGSPFTTPPVRVVALEGELRVNGATPDGAALTPDRLFDTVRAVLDRATTVHYDAATGLPTDIRANGRAGSADADTNISVTGFVVPGVDASILSNDVRAAKETWKRTRPTAFTYTWTKTAVGASSAEAAFAATLAPGSATAFEPATTTSGASSATVASVRATLDAATAAATAGAWVDLQLDGHGVPAVIAVDPSPVAGDAYWIRIEFRDTEHEQSMAAYRAAQDRWTAAGLQRYRYVWHYHGRAGTYTYRVTMRGDVSLLTRSNGSRVLWQSFDFGPRLDVIFGTIAQELANGGRVQATYDTTYGYPLNATLRDAYGNPDGTITITDFTVQ